MKVRCISLIICCKFLKVVILVPFNKTLHGTVRLYSLILQNDDSHRGKNILRQQLYRV